MFFICELLVQIIYYLIIQYICESLNFLIFTDFRYHWLILGYTICANAEAEDVGQTNSATDFIAGSLKDAKIDAKATQEKYETFEVNINFSSYVCLFITVCMLCNN